MTITLNGTTGITTPDIASDSYTGAIAVNASAPDNSLVVTSAGNVGIGTSSPLSQSKLTVAQDGVATAGGITVDQTNGASNRGGGVFLSRQGDNRASIESDYFNGLMFSNKSGTGALTEKMRIDSSGNLKFNSGYGSVATAYGCRAWVNFNGTGTVAIRASGNVSSITDNGTGDYTVNFTTAMVDANYAVALGGSRTGSASDNFGMQLYTQTTTSVRVNTFAPAINYVDSPTAAVSIFR